MLRELSLLNINLSTSLVLFYFIVSNHGRVPHTIGLDGDDEVESYDTYNNLVSACLASYLLLKSLTP